MVTSRSTSTSPLTHVRPWIVLGVADAVVVAVAVAAALALGDTSDVVLALVGGLALVVLSVALGLPIIAPLPSNVPRQHLPGLRGPGLRRGFTGGVGGGAHGGYSGGGGDRGGDGGSC